jgi:glycosyltransferase involved in cell wall biosynthesis
MNILYDNQVFTWQKCGGISRCFYELITHLDEDISFNLPIYLSNNIYLENSFKIHSHQFFPSFDSSIKLKLMKISNQFLINKAIKRQEFDIFHPTYFEPYFLSNIGKRPFVLTIHDMTPEKFPHLFPEKYDVISNKRLLVEKATRIIAVSQSTKNDILDFYSINPDKIEVIYHGASLDISVDKTLDLPEKYILFVGLRDGYKNFKSFLNAYSKINGRYPNISLICTGSPFSKEEKQLIDTYNISDKVHHYYVSDKQLSELYSSALLFVFPSLYEGFGMPILEAFANECPALLSRASCFEEIAQDAALYFDPNDVASIFETILLAIENKTLRLELISKGVKRLEFFSWIKSGKLLSEVYKNI